MVTLEGERHPRRPRLGNACLGISLEAGVAPTRRIRVLNGWLTSYAARSGATYVDCHALLVAPDDGMLPALTFDGVHLNGAGYARIEARSATPPLHVRSTSHVD